jgi:hypothetical protein
LLTPPKPPRAGFTWCSTDCDPEGESVEGPAPGLPEGEDGTL